MFKRIGLFLIGFCLFLNVNGQGRFKMSDDTKKSTSSSFSLVNNLMVISAEINGKRLSFLLDTGIRKTMLFNLKLEDSVQLRNTTKIKLRGLGEGNPINAIRSDGNYFKFQGIINQDLSLFVITDDLLDLSAKMGMDIHGIMGGDLFKEFIVKINYATQRIMFYNPKTYDASDCRGCETFPLDFYNGKPFINIVVENHLGKEIPVKLLIDSGGGDSLWLFPHSNPDIIVGDVYFDDFLGKGLNGDILGKRGRIKKIKIGSFEFENATVSYPDSTSIVRVHANKDRNGTLGAAILKRFHVVLDYKHSQIHLKKNSKYYKSPFLYNKSGIDLMYGGEMLVKENRVRINPTEQGQVKSITDIFYSYGLTYKPSYKISSIRAESPAHYAGLLAGDIILEINGKTAYSLKMEEIIYMLAQKDNKRIRLLIDRGGKHLRYEFHLKSLL